MQACVLCVADSRNAGLGAPQIEWNALVVDATGASERGNVDSGCPCPAERLRGCACSGAGGEDVVDEQDVFALHCRWIGNLERAANVLAALARCKSRLAFSGAQAHECGGREREMPAGMRLMQGVDCTLGQDAGLVETTLPVLRAMERHGNDEEAVGHIKGKLRNSACEHGPEAAGSGMDAVVL